MERDDMEKTPIVRRAEVKEFLEIAHLDRLAWKDNRNSDYIPDGEHIWRHWVEYSTVFAISIESRIVGAAILLRPMKARCTSFHKFFVEKISGIGNCLFAEIAGFLDRKNCDCMLTTDPLNSRMIHLCEKFGFSRKTFSHLIIDRTKSLRSTKTKSVIPYLRLSIALMSVISQRTVFRAGPHASELQGDIPYDTNVETIVQFSEVANLR